MELIRQVLRAVRGNVWLVFLLYGVGAALSLAFAWLLVAPLQEAVAFSGFTEELSTGFDVSLWADLADRYGATLLAKMHHLMWLIPASALWKAGASVGMLHTLQGEGYSFWRGAVRYLLPSLLLGAIFLTIMGILSVVVAVLVVMLGQLWPGEVGQTWVRFLFAPGAVAVTISICTVLRDVARAAMVVGGRPFGSALYSGLVIPFRYPSVWGPFLACMGSGSIVGMSAIIDIPVMQQVGLILVAAIIVGWYGSLCAYAQQVWATKP